MQLEQFTRVLTAYKGPNYTLVEEEEKHFGRLVTFWFGTFAMHFSANGCVFHHENTRR